MATDQEKRVDEHIKVGGYAKLAGITVDPEGKLRDKET